MLRGAPLAQYPRLPLESPSRAPSGGALRPFGAPQWLLPGRRAAPSGRARLGAFCAELRLRTWPSTWCRSSWWAPRCWAAPSPARCGRSSQPAKQPPRHAGGRAPSPGPPPASPGSTCRKLSRSSTSPRSVRRRSRRTTSIYLR